MQQDLKSQQTKQLIINEAFNLFYENGFKTTSIEKIMKATQLSKGAFYHHYKNKKEIGLEVIKLKIRKRVYEGMIIPLHANGDAYEILSSTFLNRIKSFPLYDKEHGCPMNNFINEIGDYEQTYQVALQKIIEAWKTELICLIERGKAEKTIKSSIASEAIAIYLISAFEGIRGIRKLYEDDVILDQYLMGLALFLERLKA
ncbi:TetR/AcrR family transcriptional regulator [Crocinitomix catalasitica]|uniref:TetR/AcrR family transcriptional regulator n=1 Tax=Crocinitomix catalasitica TaxID=184607 RepID=UPI000484D420|nr:TetR/AcrR family transcriptional regulator [Crocinitomix catalasitica]